MRNAFAAWFALGAIGCVVEPTEEGAAGALVAEEIGEGGHSYRGVYVSNDDFPVIDYDAPTRLANLDAERAWCWEEFFEPECGAPGLASPNRVYGNFCFDDDELVSYLGSNPYAGNAQCFAALSSTHVSCDDYCWTWRGKPGHCEDVPNTCRDLTAPIPPDGSGGEPSAHCVCVDPPEQRCVCPYENDPAAVVLPFLNGCSDPTMCLESTCTVAITRGDITTIESPPCELRDVAVAPPPRPAGGGSGGGGTAPPPRAGGGEEEEGLTAYGTLQIATEIRSDAVVVLSPD